MKSYSLQSHRKLVKVKPVVKKSIGIFLLINFVLINGYMTQATKMDASLVEAWGLTELARVNTGGDAYTVKVEGKYCFISCGYSGFRIFDISNLSAPFQVAHIPQSANGYAHQFILHKNIAFIGNGYGGIWIINCTNPEDPNVVTDYDHDYSWDVQLVEDIIYAGNGHIQPQESVTVTNISDISNPVHVKTILTDDDITDLQLVDERLYAASSTEGLLVYDITNKTDPEYLGKYQDPQNPDIYLVSFDIVNEYAYAVYYQYGFKILNITDPTNITLVTEVINENADYYSIHVRNQVAYLSNINNGIQLINVSNVLNLKEIVQYTYDNCGTNDIYNQGDILFIADRNIGLLIFNSTVKSPTTITTTSSSVGTSTTITKTTPFSAIWVWVIISMCGLSYRYNKQNT